MPPDSQFMLVLNSSVLSKVCCADAILSASRGAIVVDVKRDPTQQQQNKIECQNSNQPGRDAEVIIGNFSQVRVNISTNDQCPAKDDTSLGPNNGRAISLSATLSCPHLKALYSSYFFPVPPSAQHVDKGEDEDEAEESRQGLADDRSFRLRQRGVWSGGRGSRRGRDDERGKRAR